MRILAAILILSLILASCAKDASCPAYGRTQANVESPNRV